MRKHGTKNHPLGGWDPSLSRALASSDIYRRERHQSPFCIKSQAEGAFDVLFQKVKELKVMLVDELNTRQCFYFLKINFVPSWDEVLRCNLHQSNT